MGDDKEGLLGRLQNAILGRRKEHVSTKPVEKLVLGGTLVLNNQSRSILGRGPQYYPSRHEERPEDKLIRIQNAPGNMSRQMLRLSLNAVGNVILDHCGDGEVSYRAVNGEEGDMAFRSGNVINVGVIKPIEAKNMVIDIYIEGSGIDKYGNRTHELVAFSLEPTGSETNEVVYRICDKRGEVNFN